MSGDINMAYDDELKAAIERDAGEATKRLSAVERYEQGLLQSQRPVKAAADLAVPKLKPTAVEVLEPASPANVRPGVHLEFSLDDAKVADLMRLDLDGLPEVLVSRAVTAVNQAALKAVEAGYLLLKVKSGVEHGQFEPLIEAAGLTRQRAAEMMRMAKVLTLAPENQRANLLEMPKKKVLALASADQAVLNALMEDGPDKIDALSVRELMSEIKSMKKALMEVQVQRDTAEAELTTVRKKLHGREQRDDGVPNVVADTRQEIAVLGRQLEIGVQSMASIAQDLDNELTRSVVPMTWTDASIRQALAAMASVVYQAHGVISKLMELTGEGDALNAPALLAECQLTLPELRELHEKWRGITQVHEYEKAMRAWERAQARPKGPGRPMTKPQPPADAATA